MCGSDSVAQKLTQEVFLTLLRGLDGYDSARGALLPYLLGVAHNLSCRRLREERPMVSLDAEVDSDSEGGGIAALPQLASPECLRSELENQEALAALRKAIGSLPVVYREVLALCDLEELDYAQAAQALAIPIGTVRSRLHRARALLMERWLSDRGSQATVRYYAMTCQEFASIARDYAHRQWISPRQQDEAREHLRGCTGCRLRLEAEGALDIGLRRLRASDVQMGAGPRVEQAVMAAFAAQQQSRRPAIWRKWAWAAAIPVAAALAILYLGSRQSPVPAEGMAWQEGLPPRQEPVVQPAAERLPVPVAAESGPPPPERSRLPLRQPRSLSRPVERVSSFVPVRYGKPVEPGEPLQMIRIQLPQAELIRLGIPVPPDASRTLIQADVLLGEDGLAKAIRFVW